MVTLRFPAHLLSKTLPDSTQVIKSKSGELYLSVPSGQSIMQTLNNLGIQLTQPVVTVVNSETCDIQQILKPGDEVRLLPQISGG
jgi:molybdopterin converting factor small subunit